MTSLDLPPRSEPTAGASCCCCRRATAPFWRLRSNAAAGSTSRLPVGAAAGSHAAPPPLSDVSGSTTAPGSYLVCRNLPLLSLPLPSRRIRAADSSPLEHGATWRGGQPASCGASAATTIDIEPNGCDLETSDIDLSNRCSTRFQLLPKSSPRQRAGRRRREAWPKSSYAGLLIVLLMRNGQICNCWTIPSSRASQSKNTVWLLAD